MCNAPFCIMSAWGSIQAKHNKAWLWFKYLLHHTYQFCDVGRVKAPAYALWILSTLPKVLGIKPRAWHMLGQRS